MSIFYNPGPIPGWPTGKPRGSQAPETQEPTEPVPGAPTSIQQTTSPTADLALASTTPTRDLPPGARLDPALPRVRELRDAIQEAAYRLDPAAPPVALQILHDELWAACTAIQHGDLGTDGALIGQQFEALFERLRDLARAHTTPVPTTSLGLPADARFLQDMADYLTQRFALDDEG